MDTRFTSNDMPLSDVLHRARSGRLARVPQLMFGLDTGSGV
jgi:hypothetical protein